MYDSECDSNQRDDERPESEEPVTPAPIDPPPFAGAPMRYYEVDVGILVRWPYGRGPEALTASGWAPFNELTKFAYEGRPVSAEEFAAMRAQIFPAHADDPNWGN
jgi:hypothetical protein